MPTPGQGRRAPISIWLRWTGTGIGAPGAWDSADDAPQGRFPFDLRIILNFSKLDLLIQEIINFY